MARQEANEAFAQTSFLYGGNAAYIDELYAQYQENPASVNAEWRSFFTALKEEDADIAKNASGASWKKENWPGAENGELVSALDGDWAIDPVGGEQVVGARVQAHAAANGKSLNDADIFRIFYHFMISLRGWKSFDAT